MTMIDELEEVLGTDAPFEDGGALATLDLLGPVLEAAGIHRADIGFRIAYGAMLDDGDRASDAANAYLHGGRIDPAMALARRWAARAIPAARRGLRTMASVVIATEPYSAWLRCEDRPTTEDNSAAAVPLQAAERALFLRCGIAKIVMSYNGSEDDGCYGETLATDAAGRPVAVTGTVQDSFDQLVALTFEDGPYFGVNNEGSQGRITVDVASGFARREHHDGHYNTEDDEAAATTTWTLGVFPSGWLANLHRHGYV